MDKTPSNTKKVLIILYYWPPAGGSPVIRWLKFVKYLPAHDWTPVVYAPENPDYPSIDEGFYQDIPREAIILKRRIWEPYKLFNLFTGKGKKKGSSIGFTSEKPERSIPEKISVWIRSNFFIPDARRFWIRPSIKYLSKYLKDNPVDLIISSGPPHSTHMIGKALRAKFPVPWIADFRDPWTRVDYFQDLLLTKAALRKHERQELKVLTEADLVLTVGKTMKEEFSQIRTGAIEVITNGYDQDLKITGNQQNKDTFNLVYTGVMPASRNPHILWDVLDELIKIVPGFADTLQISLIGDIDHSVMESIYNHQLTPYIFKPGFQSHDKVIGYQQDASILLLLVNNTVNAKGILTGKFFEYLTTGKPILAIGPTDGDMAEIMKQTGAGSIAGFDDKDGLKNNLRKYYLAFTVGELFVSPTEIEKYSRKSLTGDLVERMDQLAAKNR